MERNGWGTWRQKIVCRVILPVIMTGFSLSCGMAFVTSKAATIIDKDIVSLEDSNGEEKISSSGINVTNIDSATKKPVDEQVDSFDRTDGFLMKDCYTHYSFSISSRI